jgi:hypothetical protein
VNEWEEGKKDGRGGRDYRREELKKGVLKEGLERNLGS